MAKADGGDVEVGRRGDRSGDGDVEAVAFEGAVLAEIPPQVDEVPGHALVVRLVGGRQYSDGHRDEERGQQSAGHEAWGDAG